MDKSRNPRRKRRLRTSTLGLIRDFTHIAASNSERTPVIAMLFAV
jgi:hypothetical protein